MLTEEQRKPTNVWAIYFSAALVCILFGFVGYAFFNGSIYRVINGVDDCGFICGKENDANGLSFCGSHDKRVDRYTLVNKTKDINDPNITITHSQCVSSCRNYKNYVLIANRCIEGKDPNNTAKAEKNKTTTSTKINKTSKARTNGTRDRNEEIDFLEFASVIGEDMLRSSYSVAITCGVAVVFSFILLVLFRYAIKYVAWFIYIGLVVVLLVSAVVMLAVQPIVSAVLLVLAIVFVCLLFWFRKQIQLTIKLYKETSKVLYDIPLIMFEPIVTFIVLALASFAFLYFCLVIQSSGHLKIKTNHLGEFDKAQYVQNPGMIAATYVNYAGYFWFTMLIFGCQHFIIACTVCQWYFTRSKDKLDSPILKSFSYLTRFHIGSVCLGAIVITAVKIVRVIFTAIQSSVKKGENEFARFVLSCIEYLMEILEEFLRYLIRNAYIIVALEGTPFFTSGKRAAILMKDHLAEVFALNKFGDMILFVGKVFVVLLCGFVNYEIVKRNDKIEYIFFPIFLSVIFAFLIVHCFLTVFEMAVDTVFICYCIDIEQNDGGSRPYFMSPKMQAFMEELTGRRSGHGNPEGLAMMQPDNKGGEMPYNGPQPGYYPHDPNNQPGYPPYNGQQPNYPSNQPGYPPYNDQQPGYPPYNGQQPPPQMNVYPNPNNYDNSYYGQPGAPPPNFNDGNQPPYPQGNFAAPVMPPYPNNQPGYPNKGQWQ